MSAPGTTNRWKVGCVNWPRPSAPHAVTYLWDPAQGAQHEMYWRTWEDAVAWLDGHLAKHEEASA